MMKSGSSSENSDAIKRLYRQASELVRNLDKVTRNVASLEDICRLAVINLRTRLRETCERLMFLDPVGHGKKAEDLLWRKVYYEFVLSAKNIRKNSPLSESDQHRLTNHINLGIGTYHHLLFRLQSEFKLRVEGHADFLVLSDTRGTAKEKSDSCAKKEVKDEEVNKWATQAFQRCLICMGDLARYHQELIVRSVALTSARYYHQALLISTQPPSSMPHNQLGTLVGTKNHNCDAAYNYMRCVMYDHGFEGAHGNLNRIFEKNQSSLVELAIDIYENGDLTCGRDMQVKKFIIDFLQYCEVCFKYRDANPNLAIENLCEVVHQEFQKCLEMSLEEAELSDLESESPNHLSNSLVFKFFVMNLMCIERLEKSGSTDSSAATALTLTALSHLLRHVLKVVKRKLFAVQTSQDTIVRVAQTNNKYESLQEISEVKLSSAKERPKKSSRRGRRKLRGSFSTDDSDASDQDMTSDSDSDGFNDRRASDISELGEETGNSSCSSADEKSRDKDEKVSKLLPTNGLADEGDDVHPSSDSDTDNESKTFADGIGSKDVVVDEETSFENFDFSNLDAALVLDVLSTSALLAVVKVCVDWLKSHATLIAATAQGSQKFCSRFVCLLNVLSSLEAVVIGESSTNCLGVVLSASSNADFQQTWPLVEDITLTGFGLLAKAHESIDFSLRTSVWLTEKEEVLLRMASVRQLGYLMIQCDGSYVSLDEQSGDFCIGSPVSSKAKQEDVTNDKKKSNSKNVRKNGGGREKKVRDRKKHLMQNMAQLWLEAEVKELESSLKSTGKPTFSPYLIPDCAVLTDHLSLVKQMMSSKVFIFILPTTVIQSLDDVKKESSKAREAIRWLEGEFQKRNRYLRAQKRHERLVLSMLKYPKRKEKEAWNMFAVLECGNYFARQGSAPNEVSPNLVTILTADAMAAASNSEKNNFSLFALANSLGLKVENVEELHSRWASGGKNKAERK